MLTRNNQDLINRIVTLEQRVIQLEQQRDASARKGKRPSLAFENTIHLPPSEQHHQDYPLNQTIARPPWTTKKVLLSERLTSFEYAVKAQFGQSVLFCLIGLFIGILATTIFGLRWFAAPLIALGVGSLALSIMLLDHRSLVRDMVKDAQSSPTKRQALHLDVRQYQDGHHQSNYRHLYLSSDIDREDLRLLARGVIDGKSLAVNSWIGVGGWTRTKIDNLMAELEKMAYVVPGRGNKPRQLTAKGKALFRALAE